MLNLFTRNNISNSETQTNTSFSRQVLPNSSNKQYYINRGVNNFSVNNQFVKHLTDTAKSLGIFNIGSKILYDSNQGASTWLLSGRDALKTFASENNEIESKGFIAGLFSFLSKATSSKSASLLENFYKKSQEATAVDNLGEPWEHFKAALEANHYSLMAVYDSKSSDYKDPVAFAVFESFSAGDPQKSDLFNKLAEAKLGLEQVPNNLIYLDKYLTKNSFDMGLDMKSFEKNVIGAFMNSEDSRGKVLVVPWQTDPVQGLNYEIIKGINHIGFSKRGSGVEITKRHEIGGQSHPALKADTLFSKFPLNLDATKAKAISLAGAVNEVSAGPRMRINNSMLKPIKKLVQENFKNIEKAYPSAIGDNASGAFNLFGFFDALVKLGRKVLPG